MKLVIGGNDFTSLCEYMTLESDISWAADVLTCRIIFENHDGYLPPVYAKTGDDVRLYDGENTVFSGEAVSVTTYGADGVFEVQAMERSHVLAKSHVKGYFEGREGLERAFSQAGITLKSCPALSYAPFSSRGGLTAWDVFKKAAGDSCYLRYGSAADIIKKGTTVYSADSSSIISIVSKDDAEDICSKAVVVGYGGRELYSASDKALSEKYGQVTKYITAARNADGKSLAQSALKGEIKRAEVTLIGTFVPQKGGKTDFFLERYGLSGRYDIVNVLHTAEEGVLLTTLTAEREER